MDHSEHDMNMHGAAMDMHASHDPVAVIGDTDDMSHAGMDHSSMVGMDHSNMAGMEGMDHSSMMMMYFHFSVNSTILFKGWTTETVAGLIGSMVAIFLMAFFYEGLKYFREYLFKKSVQRSSCSRKDAVSTDDQTVQYFDQVFIPSPITMISWTHFIQTILHVIQFVISYFLMLIFMTYNAWLCIAVALGCGVGYFVFGWRKSVVVDVTEHCH